NPPVRPQGPNPRRRRSAGQVTAAHVTAFHMISEHLFIAPEKRPLIWFSSRTSSRQAIIARKPVAFFNARE
ncbi:MAG: hypothetical protein OXE86_21435, partial [Alphaproteobacteria bacterium]|nr:hypothetical protein [Alphaproteobacteria bacterium]